MKTRSVYRGHTTAAFKVYTVVLITHLRVRPDYSAVRLVIHSFRGGRNVVKYSWVQWKGKCELGMMHSRQACRFDFTHHVYCSLALRGLQVPVISTIPKIRAMWTSIHKLPVWLTPASLYTLPPSSVPDNDRNHTNGTSCI